MIEIFAESGFKKKYKKWIKKHPDLQNQFKSTIDLFVENPYHKSLKTHSLSGKLKNLMAISITYEFRLIFKFIEQNKVLLIDIGTHDEVY